MKVVIQGMEVNQNAINRLENFNLFLTTSVLVIPKVIALKNIDKGMNCIDFGIE